MQKSFGLKEQQIKMSSSLLNVSKSSGKLGQFRSNDIEVLADTRGQNLFKRTHVEKFLKIGNIRRSTVKAS